MRTQGFLYHEELHRSSALIERMRSSPVAICGAGALGANIAESLARSGFGSLTVIDRDRIEERNLSTQPYQRGDIGQWKGKILANILYRAVGTRFEVHARELTAANAAKLLAGAALVVDTFDNSPSRRAVAEWCAASAIPCVHAGLAASYGEVTWNEIYRVPSAAQDDICDYPLARNLVMMTASIACESIIRYFESGARTSYALTFGDMTIREVDP